MKLTYDYDTSYDFGGYYQGRVYHGDTLIATYRASLSGKPIPDHGLDLVSHETEHGWSFPADMVPGWERLSEWQIMDRIAELLNAGKLTRH